MTTWYALNLKNNETETQLFKTIADAQQFLKYYLEDGIESTIEVFVSQEQLAAAELTIKTMRQAAQALIDRWDSPDWKDATHTADYIHALRDAVNDAEREQPTPSQSVDERKEFEKAATELGLSFCGRFVDEHYKLWKAHANLAKPQPTSQDDGDAEYETNIALREASHIHDADAYFNARPHIDTLSKRGGFEAGYEKGWQAHANLSKPQPTSQDSERLEWMLDWFMRGGKLSEIVTNGHMTPYCKDDVIA